MTLDAKNLPPFGDHSATGRARICILSPRWMRQLAVDVAVVLSVAVAAVMVAFWPSVAAAQDPILVVGHKNPDTDAIVSAIAAAALQSALGQPAQARAQGEPNAETRYVLQRFGFAPPPVQTAYAGRRVILVDHSDVALAPDDLRQAQLVGLYDHHKLGDVQSDEPLEMVAMPVGSTATVLQELFAQRRVAIEPRLAGIMLGAILSDTRVFSSPTTTARDRASASILAGLAGVGDVQAFGRALLSAYNTHMRSMSNQALLGIDLKVFRMGGAKVGISQIEALDIGFLQARLPGLRQAMDAEVRRAGLQALVLAITDVEQQGSLVLAAGPQADRARSALGLGQTREVWQPGLMSRKQQLVPALEKVFAR